MLPKGTKAFGTLFYLGTSKLYEPGPTFWLSFKFCCVFSPLNTNAINFIYYYQQTLINDILGQFNAAQFQRSNNIQIYMYYKLLFCLLTVAYLQAIDEPHQLPLYVGRSYDLLSANPLSKQVDPGFEHSIFEFSYSKKVTTEDGRYLVPDGVSHRKVSSCTFSTDVRTYRGTKSYQEQLKTKATISGGYKGILVDAAFSSSASYQTMLKETFQSNMSLTHATAECEAYELSIDIFTVNTLLPNFVTGVIESYQTKNWDKFITQFGTHFVYDVTMGGRVIQEIAYDYQSVSKLNSIDIDISIAAKASFAKFFADSSFDWHKHEQEIAYAQKLSRTTNQLYIGGEPPKDGNIHSWVDHVIENPMPIKYKVIDLSQLFSKVKGSAFNHAEAVQQYHQALDKYCQRLGCRKPLPDKPKPRPATSVEARSNYYGGNGGQAFEFLINSTTLNAMKFIIRHGATVDNIQILLGDGVKKAYTPARGGSGGSSSEWVVPVGQFVQQIEYRSDRYVDSLTFITNTGAKSPSFGGGGGNYHLQTFPEGYRIIGFYGRSADRVDQLGFILAKTIYHPYGRPQLEIIRKQLQTE